MVEELGTLGIILPLHCHLHLLPAFLALLLHGLVSSSSRLPSAPSRASTPPTTSIRSSEMSVSLLASPNPPSSAPPLTLISSTTNKQLMSECHHHHCLLPPQPHQHKEIVPHGAKAPINNWSFASPCVMPFQSYILDLVHALNRENGSSL